MEILKLISKDNIGLKVRKKAIVQKSRVIKNMLEEGEEEDDTELKINVNKNILLKIIEFVEHNFNKEYIEIKKPIFSSKMENLTNKWNAEFIDHLDKNTLFELVTASDYLNIKCLLDLSCAKIATMIKGKTPQEIRKTFDIINDFTPEEETRVMEENTWLHK